MTKLPIPVPMSGLKFARAYVVDQPYSCVASPAEGFKVGTIFPFLLETYAPSLKKALKGEEPWAT
ncbi:MAG TPA: hypothetical protein DD429_07470 [Clostridiaceae bacterium]|nr:hypothetical protein [Clostridiaceae bacterium]